MVVWSNVVLFKSVHMSELEFFAENRYVGQMCRKKSGCWHRQNGYINDVHDPNTRFIYAWVLESEQATVAAAGVGAVVPPIFPSARQQEQEQASELTTASLWLCIPAPAFLRFSPIELQSLIFSVLVECILSQHWGSFWVTWKKKILRLQNFWFCKSSHSLLVSVILHQKFSVICLYIYAVYMCTHKHVPS